LEKLSTKKKTDKKEEREMKEKDKTIFSFPFHTSIAQHPCMGSSSTTPTDWTFGKKVF
jgi:hypothetical protein